MEVRHRAPRLLKMLVRHSGEHRVVLVGIHERSRLRSWLRLWLRLVVWIEQGSSNNRIGVRNELKVFLVYLENWLRLSLVQSRRTATAVVSDLNIYVEMFSRLGHVRPLCGGGGAWGGLHRVDERHERVELMIRYLLRNGG